MVGAIFVLCLSPAANARGRAWHWCHSHSSTKVSWPMQPPQGTPLEHLALVAGKNCILGPPGSETIRDSFPLATAPRSPQTAYSLKRTPSLPVKKAYLFVLELQPEWQASGLSYK